MFLEVYQSTYLAASPPFPKLLRECPTFSHNSETDEQSDFLDCLCSFSCASWS